MNPLVILGILFVVSEALSLSSATKSNGVVQLLDSIVKDGLRAYLGLPAGTETETVIVRSESDGREIRRVPKSKAGGDG